jgi:3-oxoacyl-[acyl-carrier protein] reductase
MMDLSGKVVLVTGASRGLGQAIALRCAERGADVVVNYASSQEQAEEVAETIRAAGRRSRVIGAKVEDYDSVVSMMKQVVDEFGRIDVLVNNAGVLLRGLVMMCPPADFQTVLNTNITGAFHCIKAASRHMVSKRSGSIINISSVAGTRGLKGQGAYAASKAALNSLTTVAAKEFASYGIRVNGVAPGCIYAGMMKSFSEETKTDYLSGIPLGRYGDAAEIGDAVAFLASSASSYITGQILTVDGGMSVA